MSEEPFHGAGFMEYNGLTLKIPFSKEGRWHETETAS
jgi:hypothetical protein